MKPPTSNSFYCPLAAGVSLFVAPLLQAADATWLGITGNWGAIGTWSGGTISDGADCSVNFIGADIVAAQTITLDAARTIGNITFNDATTSSNASIDGDTCTLGGQASQISYVGDKTSPGVGIFTDGDDVVLMVIPAPSVVATLGSLGAFASIRRSVHRQVRTLVFFQNLR